MNLASIGLGRVASYYANAIPMYPDFQLVEAYDYKSLGKKKPLFPGIRMHDSLESLMDNPDIDLFIIATPNKTHAKLAKHLLESGKNIIVEKPLCMTSQELDEIVHLRAEKKALVYSLNHAMFGNEVKWLVEKGERYGLNPKKLKRFECGFYNDYIQDGMLNPGTQVFGGAWHDSGINALSVMSRFIDMSKLILKDALFTSIPQIDCTEIQARCSYPFESGAGFVDTNWTLGKEDKKTRLEYEHMTLIIDHSGESFEIYQGGELIDVMDFKTKHGRMVNNYTNAIGYIHELFLEKKDNFDEHLPTNKLFVESCTKGLKK